MIKSNALNRTKKFRNYGLGIRIAKNDFGLPSSSETEDYNEPDQLRWKKTDWQAEDI